MLEGVRLLCFPKLCKAPPGVWTLLFHSHCLFMSPILIWAIAVSSIATGTERLCRLLLGKCATLFSTQQAIDMSLARTSNIAWTSYWFPWYSDWLTVCQKYILDPNSSTVAHIGQTDLIQLCMWMQSPTKCVWGFAFFFFLTPQAITDSQNGSFCVQNKLVPKVSGCACCLQAVPQPEPLLIIC